MRKGTWQVLLISAVLAASRYGVADCVAERMPTEAGAGFGLGEEYSGSYLGVDIEDVTKDRVGPLKLKEEQGAEITMVDGDAPAARAGLKEHDVILTLNGSPVESVEQLRRMIHETPPGRVVTLGISRDGRPMTFKIETADRSKIRAAHAGAWQFKVPPAELPAMPEMDLPAFDVMVHSSSRSGLLVENLTPQLGEFFGVKNGQGVLVRSVEKGSVAEASGFRAGDVIVSVGGEKVSDVGDWRRTMRSHRSGTVSIGIVRDRREQNVSLSVPPPKQSRKEWEVELEELPIEARVNLQAVQQELDRLRPELERATREVQKQLCDQQKEMAKQSQRAAAEAQHKLRQQQEELQRQLRDAQRQLQESLREI